MLSHHYQQALDQAMPFYGQRVQIRNEAWEICKERFGFVGELTGIVSGFMCDEESVSLMVIHDSDLPNSWADETDVYFIDQVEILTPVRELVTV